MLPDICPLSFVLCPRYDFLNLLETGSFFVLSQQIFNSKLVLASPETASDGDYAAILGVIGHEVCHN